MEYAQAHRLSKLNYFERALLVQKLKFFGKGKEAQNLAAAMELPLKNTKPSGEMFKVFFETVLNSKKTEEKKR